MSNTHSKRIIITGVTRGLGLAMAEKFITLGHTIIGCGRTAQRLAHMQQKYGNPHDFAPVDVAREEQVRNWACKVLADHGPPDLLLNNAGLINRNAPLWQVPSGEFSEVIDVNIKGTVNVLRWILPAMIDRKEGVVVNFSSGWGTSTSPEVAPYCATKWAIEGLTGALAQELPPGLAAISFNPGIIDTEMLRSCFGDEASNYPTARQWAEKAVPFLLQLGPGDNGKSLTAPS